MHLTGKITDIVTVPSRLLDHIRAHVAQPLYRNSYLLFMKTALGSALGFVFWVIVARLFDPESVGLGSAAVSAAALVAGFANLGLGFGLIRYLPGLPPDKRQALIASSYALAAVVAVVGAFAYLTAIPYVSPGLGLFRENAPWRALFVGAVVAWAVVPLIDNALLADRLADRVLLRDMVMHVTKTALPFALLALGGTIAVFGAYAGSIALSCLVGAWLVHHRRPRVPFHLASLLEVVRAPAFLGFSLGNHVGNYLQMAPSVVLPLIVLGRLGPEESAYYYVSFMVASLLYAVASSIATSAFVEGSHESAESIASHRRPFRKALKLSALLVGVAMALGLLLAPLVLRAFGPEYAQAVTLLRILVLSAPAYAALALLLSYWRVENRVANINVFAALWSAGIVAGAFLAPDLGSLGLAHLFGPAPAIAYGLVSVMQEPTGSAS